MAGWMHAWMHACKAGYVRFDWLLSLGGRVLWAAGTWPQVGLDGKVAFKERLMVSLIALAAV